MVMIFAVKEARQQLLQKGVVATFRFREHEHGHDWATDKRNGKKICNIFVQPIESKFRCLETDMDEVKPFTSISGFKSWEEWFKVVDSLNPYPNRLPWGFLYIVINLDSIVQK